jgi:lauroyl/myristoyl acyltransferase
MSDSRQVALHPDMASLDHRSRPPWISAGDLGYLSALVLATCLDVLPSAVRAGFIYWLSRVAGTIWYYIGQEVVRRVRCHIQVLFSDAGHTLRSLVRAHLILASWNALVINLLPSLRDEHLGRLVQIEGLHYLDEYKERGEPILLLGAHYGTYGFAIAAALSARGYPVWLVGYGDRRSPPPRKSRLYKKLYWPRVQRLNQRVRITTVDPEGESQQELLEILQSKSDICYLLPDQYFVVHPGQRPSSHLVPLRLLDRTVYLDVTGVRLAKQVGARPLTALPVPGGHRQRVVIEPLEWTGGGTATTAVARDLQVYLARLERHLLECPSFWRDLRRSDLLPRMGIFKGEGGNYLASRPPNDHGGELEL